MSDEFKNKLIVKEEAYQNGLFPQIPNFEKHGSAFVLTNGCNDDIVVTERTTIKQIRKGKYSTLVEISTRPYTKEIRFTAPGKEAAYSFDVYVKAVIQVKDPICFYENRNLDVDAYFNNLFLMDVKKITRRYSILDYDGMDEELTKKLSSYNTIDETTGFSYTISVVDAQPGKKAQEYVERLGRQQLDAGLKGHARGLTNVYSTDYEEAIMTEVTEGKLTEEEAILRIENHRKADFDQKMERIDELRKKGIITDTDARESLKEDIKGISIQKSVKAYLPQSEEDEVGMDQFYTEEE